MLQKFAKTFANFCILQTCKSLQTFDISILLQPITSAKCMELHIHIHNAETIDQMILTRTRVGLGIPGPTS